MQQFKCWTWTNETQFTLSEELLKHFYLNISNLRTVTGFFLSVSHIRGSKDISGYYWDKNQRTSRRNMTISNPNTVAIVQQKYNSKENYSSMDTEEYNLGSYCRLPREKHNLVQHLMLRLLSRDYQSLISVFPPKMESVTLVFPKEKTFYLRLPVQKIQHWLFELLSKILLCNQCKSAFKHTSFCDG